MVWSQLQLGHAPTMNDSVDMFGMRFTPSEWKIQDRKIELA